MTRAVVFGYHNVGVRCLRTLIAAGVDVPLVLTHEDDPAETIWFDSVARTAADYDLMTIAPPDPNATEGIERVAACRPDFIFSFYYRAMLRPALLAIPPRGALNMHGSLLPKYRGAAPIQWAIACGEKITGVTTMRINAGLDTGDILLQREIPVAPDDTAVTIAPQMATVGAEMNWPPFGVTRPKLATGACVPEKNEANSQNCLRVQRADG